MQTSIPIGTSQSSHRPRQLVQRTALVAGFALLTAIAAQVKFFLPSTPVPVTLQTLVVVLAGATMGWRLGAAATGLYLLIGTLGAPVFALSNYGFASLLGPTGGYLLAFVAVQPAIDWCMRSTKQAWLGLMIAGTVGHMLILLIGASWLSLWMRCDIGTAIELGVLPFLFGSLLKIGAATAVGAPLARFTRGMA